VKWISVDPGAVHVGLAQWDGEELMHASEVSPVTLLAWLAYSWEEVELVVIEAYTLLSPRFGRGTAKHSALTLELIGKVKGICMVRQVDVVEQQPAVRHVAMRSRWWRELEGKPANDHARSAIAHGIYWLRFKEMSRTPVKNR
jgi:hypothetical protein